MEEFFPSLSRLRNNFHRKAAAVTDSGKRTILAVLGGTFQQSQNLGGQEDDKFWVVLVYTMRPRPKKKKE